MRFLEAPDALEFLDGDKLRTAREFSLLYERLAAFIVDRAKPTTPLNRALDRGVDTGPQGFIEAMLPVLGLGDPRRIVENLARIRESSAEWAEEGTEDDAMWVARVNECIDALGRELDTVPRLRELAATLFRAASRDGGLSGERTGITPNSPHPP
jgi:hypothetical protein